MREFESHRRNMKECTKKSFDSLGEANDRIREIRTEDEISDTKPIRAYRCKSCTKYHITSMNMSQFDKHKKALNKKSRERFSEVSFWCKKLGVNNHGEEIQRRRK